MTAMAMTMMTMVKMRMMTMRMTIMRMTPDLDEVIARLCPGMRGDTVKRHLRI